MNANMKTISNKKVEIVIEKLSERGLSSLQDSEVISSAPASVGEVTEYDDAELPLWQMMLKVGVV